MTDHSLDGDIKKPGPHDDATLVPKSGDEAAHQDGAAAETSAQAALTARAGGAPTVVVQAPRTPPAPVVVQIDGREVARAVTRDAEGESIRRGGHGVQD